MSRYREWPLFNLGQIIRMVHVNPQIYIGHTCTCTCTCGKALGDRQRVGKSVVLLKSCTSLTEDIHCVANELAPNYPQNVHTFDCVVGTIII